MAIIYGVPASPFVRKVMMAHAVKGLDYEFELTMPKSDDAEFREASPLGKIPGYRTDDGFGFSDSAVIVAYIERLPSAVNLYPADNNQMAKALWLERYCDTQLMEVTAALYFQKIIGPKFFQMETDQERVTELVSKLIPAELDYVESQATDGWFVGGQITIADIAIASNMFNLMHVDFDLTNWPKLNAFVERLRASDFAKAQLEAELNMLNQAL